MTQQPQNNTKVASPRAPAKRPIYRRPQLTAFGALTEVTLGLSQPGQESGGGGTRCNTVGIDC